MEATSSAEGNLMKPILIDMDGVIADFTNGVRNTFAKIHPDLVEHFPEEKDIKSFYIEDSIEDESVRLMMKEKIGKLIDRQPIFLCLSPLENAVSGVEQLRKTFQNDVFFCSSPHVPNKDGYADKATWIDMFFPGWGCKNLILTKDKTLVDGIVLIDDKPNPIGNYEAKWKHVVFNQPWNSEGSDDFEKTEGKYRMMDWSKSELDNLIEYIKSNGGVLK